MGAFSIYGIKGLHNKYLLANAFSWYGSLSNRSGERAAAAQLAAFLMVFVLILIVWERRSLLWSFRY
ncbi:MAG: hypothetical protein ACFCU7_02275 [Pleurocapsa sp.]